MRHLKPEAIYHTARIGINNQHNLIAFMVILGKPYRSMQELNIANI